MAASTHLKPLRGEQRAPARRAGVVRAARPDLDKVRAVLVDGAEHARGRERGGRHVRWAQQRFVKRATVGAVLVERAVPAAAFVVAFVVVAVGSGVEHRRLGHPQGGVRAEQRAGHGGRGELQLPRPVGQALGDVRGVEKVVGQLRDEDGDADEHLEQRAELAAAARRRQLRHVGRAHRGAKPDGHALQRAQGDVARERDRERHANAGGRADRRVDQHRAPAAVPLGAGRPQVGPDEVAQQDVRREESPPGGQQGFGRARGSVEPSSATFGTFSEVVGHALPRAVAVHVRRVHAEELVDAGRRQPAHDARGVAVDQPRQQGRHDAVQHRPVGHCVKNEITR